VVEDNGIGLITGAHLYSWPGIFTIAITVADDDGGTCTASFVSKVVPIPQKMIPALKEYIEILGLPHGIENSLNASLKAADNALTRGGSGDLNAARKTLEAFCNKVEAQRGKKLTSEEANQLIQFAQEIISYL
jgi:hypothetical protein